MPESMSLERRAMLQALGAKLVLTPAKEGMKGAIAKAQELAASTPTVGSRSNSRTRPIRRSTNRRPARKSGMIQVDVLTFSLPVWGRVERSPARTRYIRRHNPDLQAIAVEPADSPVISGASPAHIRFKESVPGLFPNLDTSLLSGVETVTNEEAFAWARRLRSEEGILGGISTGANVAAATRIAARPENHRKVIVTIAPSFGERYLSTPLYQGLAAAAATSPHNR